MQVSEKLKELEQEVKLLKEQVHTLRELQTIKLLTETKEPFDISKELTKRKLDHNQVDIRRINEIITTIKGVNKETFLTILDKVSLANQRQPIRNLPAYINVAIKKHMEYKTGGGA